MSRKSKAEQHMYDRGRTTWHSTEQRSGPDVGISLGLGNGRMIWCGEISRGRWEQAGDDAASLGPDLGWWVILYTHDNSSVIGKCVSTESAQQLMEELEAAFMVPATAP